MKLTYSEVAGNIDKAISVYLDGKITKEQLREEYDVLDSLQELGDDDQRHLSSGGLEFLPDEATYLAAILLGVRISNRSAREERADNKTRDLIEKLIASGGLGKIGNNALKNLYSHNIQEPGRDSYATEKMAGRLSFNVRDKIAKKVPRVVYFPEDGEYGTIECGTPSNRLAPEEVGL